MKKRTNTAKWIESSKRWQINVQKNGKRRTFTCSDPGRAGQRKCHEKADEWLDDSIDGSVKVEKMYNDWLEEVKLNKGTGSYTNYESFGRIHILPEIGARRIDTLNEQDFQNIINKAFRKGLSYKSLANIRGCMQTFLKFCRKNKVSSLALNDLEISNKAPKGEKKVLQPKDFRTLLSCTDYENFWYLNAFKLYALTGLRRGELLALRKKSYSNGQIKVSCSLNKFGEETPGKTTNSQRDFILTDIADEIMQNQLKKISTIKTQYIFPDKFGQQAKPASVYSQWKRFCKKYDIPHISLHELRHTFISMCKEVPIELLKQTVGHSVSMDTFGQYGHELEGEKQLTRDLITQEFKKHNIL